MYSYSFEPNPSWPNHFSPQPVLLDYFRGVAERHDLRRHIRFETTVEEMVWNEARQLWQVRLTLADGSTDWVRPVHPAEAFLDDERISARAPLAAAVLGLTSGDRGVVAAPCGPLAFTVVRIG